MQVVQQAALAATVAVAASLAVLFGLDQLRQPHAETEIKIATIDVRRVSDEIFRRGGIGTAGISDVDQLTDRIKRASASLADQGYLVVNKPLILAAPEALQVFDATDDVVKAVLGDR